MGDKKSNNIHKSLRDGGTPFFEELYSDHFEKLCVYLLNFTSDKHVINDVVQDSFLYLWTHRKKILITDSIKSYLYRMAYNKLMDFFRKNTKRKDVLLSYHKTILDEVIQNENDVKEERLKKLDKCIELLPKKCKDVFYNKKIKGLKSKEVAINLNISIKTVEAHITKAYILIRRCLKQEKESIL
ncbi:RNA polymerase sigma factor [Flavivirga eckloniae]|uniref:RNA polymerase sigma-70 factor n=1 Tax=Flavivirga eckloniae TaxID=1803846 RepID=A0A2K9PTX2_9FLAO|nr:sigma-70 family RNA polymerase sigma factor [Flavivirga eckloniae]AUP80520.1 RNA polymerase sigma-70 factor [Flavivirga eckloniae]